VSRHGTTEAPERACRFRQTEAHQSSDRHCSFHARRPRPRRRTNPMQSDSHQSCVCRSPAARRLALVLVLQRSRRVGSRPCRIRIVPSATPAYPQNMVTTTAFVSPRWPVSSPRPSRFGPAPLSSRLDQSVRKVEEHDECSPSFFRRDELESPARRSEPRRSFHAVRGLLGLAGAGWVSSGPARIRGAACDTARAASPSAPRAAWS
jgi:hypothetical protein